jgi:hypothetical protein
MANPALTNTKRKTLDEQLRTVITTEVNSHILPSAEGFRPFLESKHGSLCRPKKKMKK